MLGGLVWYNLRILTQFTVISYFLFPYLHPYFPIYTPILLYTSVLSIRIRYFPRYARIPFSLFFSSAPGSQTRSWYL